MNQGITDTERIRTILLVEDDEPTRLFIQRFLERDGFEVVAVDAAEEGIVEAGGSIPDVLISDVHLPGLNGIELASFLLSQDPDLPVILMTGDPDEDLAQRALACGPVQYLLKPFEWFEMEAAVGFALQRRQAKEPAGDGESGEVTDSEPVPAGPMTVDDRPDSGSEQGADPGPGASAEGEPVGGAAPGVPVPAVEEPNSRKQPLDAPVAPAEPDSTTTAGPSEPADSESGPVRDVSPEASERSEPGSGQAAGDVEADAELVVEPEPPQGSGDDTPASEWVELELIPEDEDLPAAVPGAAEARANGEGQVPTPADVDPKAWVEEADRMSWAGPGHGDRVAGLILALYEAMDERRDLQVEDLSLAARVHEVGRLQLPEGEPVELAVRGAEVLAEAGFPEPVTKSVRHMHERWDGTGGPEQSSGSRIPIGAQLLAVADALDHYSTAWIRAGVSPAEAAGRAINLVTVQQNQAFSPIVVGAMHQASARLGELCARDRPPDLMEASPIPAMAAAESVPFALFAAE